MRTKAEIIGELRAAMEEANVVSYLIPANVRQAMALAVEAIEVGAVEGEALGKRLDEMQARVDALAAMVDAVGQVGSDSEAQDLKINAIGDEVHRNGVKLVDLEQKLESLVKLGNGGQV